MWLIIAQLWGWNRLFQLKSFLPVELTVVSYYRQQYFQLLDWVTACWCDWIKGNNDMWIYSNFEELILGKMAPNDAQDNMRLFQVTTRVCLPLNASLIFRNLDLNRTRKIWFLRLTAISLTVCLHSYWCYFNLTSHKLCRCVSQRLWNLQIFYRSCLRLQSEALAAYTGLRPRSTQLFPSCVRTTLQFFTVTWQLILIFTNAISDLDGLNDLRWETFGSCNCWINLHCESVGPKCPGYLKMKPDFFSSSQRQIRCRCLC